MKFIKGSENIDNILNNQRLPDDKIELGYKESMKFVKGESSTIMPTSEKPTSYTNDLKGQLNESKYNKKKQQKMDQPNYEARKQHVPESYQPDRQRMIPTSKFFIPRNPFG